MLLKCRDYKRNILSGYDLFVWSKALKLTCEGYWGNKVNLSSVLGELLRKIMRYNKVVFLGIF